jgi:Uma2 family endonuclease
MAIIMSIVSKPMTADELLAMPQDSLRCELIKGELRTMAPAGYEHGDISMRLSLLLAQHIRSNKLGVPLGAETGFKLSSSPDTVCAPDFAFVHRERVPPRGFKKFFNGAPDLAVEVLSPDDRQSEVKEKISDWLNAGCQAVWVVDPKRKTVAIHHSATEIRICTTADELSDETVVPGFRCQVADLFADA